MDVDVDWTRSTPHLLFVIYVMVLHTIVACLIFFVCRHADTQQCGTMLACRPMLPYVQWLRRPLWQHSQPSSLLRIVLARKMLANWTPWRAPQSAGST